MNDSYSDDDRLANSDPGPARPYIDPEHNQMLWEMREALQQIAGVSKDVHDQRFRFFAEVTAQTVLAKWDGK